MRTYKTGLEVIKLEYNLRLKIKRNDWLLADTCPQVANHCSYFESENKIKFYNLEASWSLLYNQKMKFRLCFSFPDKMGFETVCYNDDSQPP